MRRLQTIVLFWLCMAIIFTSAPISALATEVNKESETEHSEDLEMIQQLDLSPTDLESEEEPEELIMPLEEDGQPYSVPEPGEKGITRYTVLVLDQSGSMSGIPMNNMKKAAIRFCTQVFETNGTNYVAIVSYGTSAYSRMQFTSSIDEATQVIENLYAKGGTNTNEGLITAGNLLAETPSGDDIIKNLVLLSDGLPQSGSKTKDGPYKSKDYSNYQYANAAFNTAKSYWDQYNIYTLGFFHALYGDELKFGRKFMNDLQNKGYYDVTDPDQLDFIFGEIADDLTDDGVEFSYASGKERDYKAICHYKDSYFDNISCGEDALDGFNHSLATASLCLALSAFGSNEGGNKDYSQKYKNVKDLFEKLNFNNFQANEWYEKKPQSDSIGVAAASKNLVVDDKDYTLVALAVRGGGYESEWAGNFTIGRTGEHYGFSKAKEQVLDFLRHYIANNHITGEIKLWLTGYSRAAATANMVAGAIDNGENLGDVTLEKENLYAYCFETPRGVLISAASDVKKYYNIYNIINKNDPVPLVAMQALKPEGFTRYGVDYILPDKTTDERYTEKRAEMLDFYNNMNSFEEVGQYEIDNFMSKKIEVKYLLPGGNSPVQDDIKNNKGQGFYLDETINKLTKEQIKTRDNYVNEFQNGIRVCATAIYGTLFPDEPLDRTNKFIESFTKKISSMNMLSEIASAVFNPLDSRSLEDVVNGIVKESLHEAGIKNYNFSALSDFVKAIVKLAVEFIVSHPNLTITGVANFNTLMAAHYPELCLAWLMSMDSNYTKTPSTFGGIGNYRIIRINCPVDVKVYDSAGSLKAEIVKDVPQENSESSLLVMLNEDGEKIICLPSDMSYDIQITATDEGIMDYAINEYSTSIGDITRIENYLNIKLQTGDKFMAEVPAYSTGELGNNIKGTSTDYTLKDHSGNLLQPSENLVGEQAEEAYYMITVKADYEERGIVIGQGVRQRGHYAKIEAVAKEGYEFSGWYQGDALASQESSYRFRVEEDIEFVAHFIKKKSSPEDSITPDNPDSPGESVDKNQPSNEVSKSEGENESLNTDKKKGSVNTGDNNSIIWFFGMTISVIMIHIISNMRKRKRN